MTTSLSNLSNGPLTPVTLEPPKPKLKARYALHLKGGRIREVAAYEEREGRYRVQFLSGGYLNYDKDQVSRIEELPVVKAEHEMRIWTSVEGRTLEARFISHVNGVVAI